MNLLAMTAPVLQASNPLVPSALEWTYMSVGLLHVALFVAVLFWLPRQRGLSPLARLGGLLISFVIPVLGSLIVWIVAPAGTQSPDSFTR